MAKTSQHILQAGAIPLHEGKVCLVTSSSRKRWVIPKGLIDPGQTAKETALQEAWEEAGLTGDLRYRAAGSYRYDKWGGTCQVTVYEMHVTDIADDWPECDLRDRIWVLPARALQLLDEPGLRDILRAVTER